MKLRARRSLCRGPRPVPAGGGTGEKHRATKPMSARRRYSNYMAQNPHGLTAAQTRRLRHKAKVATLAEALK